MAVAVSASVAVVGGVACTSGEGAASGDTTTGARRAQGTITGRAAGPSAWLTEEEVKAWQDEHGKEGAWVVGVFFRPGPECTKDFAPELVRRFHLIPDDEDALSQERLLAEALAVLERARPAGLSNALEGIRLDLRETRVDGGTLFLDLGRGISETNSRGTCGGTAMAYQFVAVAHHYFPHSAAVCVLVNGTPSGERGDALLFHDSVACPISLDT
jgi:hypothetical protein